EDGRGEPPLPCPGRPEPARVPHGRPSTARGTVARTRRDQECTEGESGRGRGARPSRDEGRSVVRLKLLHRDRHAERPEEGPGLSSWIASPSRSARATARPSSPAACSWPDG